MTQAELAEPLMTKGMLSHVEKGKANLSMKNLIYIADKLNKPLSYFIDDNTTRTNEQIKSNSTIPHILINKELRDIDKMIRLNIKNTARDKIYKLIARYDLSKDIVLKAEVLIRLARVQNSLSLYEEATENYKKVADLYNSVKLFNLSSSILLELSNMNMTNGNEDEALSTLNLSKSIYDMSPSADVSFELSHSSSMLLYHTSRCNLDMMIEVSKKLITQAKELKAFHEMSLPYLINAVQGLYQYDEQSALISINMLKSYGTIVDNEQDVVLADILTARLYNNIGNFEFAKEYLNGIDLEKSDKIYSNHIKALYYFELGRLYIATKSYSSATSTLQSCLEHFNTGKNPCCELLKIIVEMYININLTITSNGCISTNESFTNIYNTIDSLYEEYKDNHSYIGVMIRYESAMIYKYLSYVLESMDDFKGAYNALTKANSYFKNN